MEAFDVGAAGRWAEPEIPIEVGGDGSWLELAAHAGPGFFAEDVDF